MRRILLRKAYYKSSASVEEVVADRQRHFIEFWDFVTLALGNSYKLSIDKTFLSAFDISTDKNFSKTTHLPFNSSASRSCMSPAGTHSFKKISKIVLGWFSYCLERVRFDNKCVLPKYFPFLCVPIKNYYGLLGRWRSARGGNNLSLSSPSLFCYLLSSLVSCCSQMLILNSSPPSCISYVFFKFSTHSSVIVSFLWYDSVPSSLQVTW